MYDFYLSSEINENYKDNQSLYLINLPLVLKVLSIVGNESIQLSTATDSKSSKSVLLLVILASDIGINPNNDGKVIRLAFPELTEERRKDLVKDIKKMAEEAKIAIRAIRRDGIEEAKQEQKDGNMTEDELKQAENDIQKLTDSSVEEIDKILANKEKEVMSV